ncbi:MarR family winged helix-turn-helix transcriptional regulator [Leeia aquatica]|uniref:MarR family transcriptional regulator n=1 Tax=Leeia aquatica TaxID=2725557 RepID=A0A847SIE2_9NEIS|nr:MarR family transcriptional regulator [Leeia aquatica]NLR75652.1 MarR family transcriptional regulator [Leeia aquatica]
MSQQDHVDQVLAQWQQQRPDLDPSSTGIFGRLNRMSQIAMRQIESVMLRHGLKSSEFDVLATLRRHNCPLTPTALYRTMMLTSGAVTGLVDRLEARGLVERIASQEDRRSLLVRLTPAGHALIDQAMNDHLANQQQMLAPFSPAQREQLAMLLRQWLLLNEQDVTNPADKN